MAGQRYSTVAGILEEFRGRTLARAIAAEMLSKLGAMEEMPQNKSENITWPRYLPYGGVDNQWMAAGGDTTFINAHLIQEGVTPTADSLSYTTVGATLQQIGCLYSYTDKTEAVHEEGKEIPMEMERQVAERIALCREMMCYGEMKSCTNDFYGGIGTTPATVSGPPTLSMFQDITRAIRAAHGTTINSMLSSSQNFGTQAVQASFTVYCHTDMEKTFENMVGFTPVKDYGAQKLIDPDYEIGAVGRFRIIVNPVLTYIPDYGAAVGTWTGSGAPKSTTGTKLDVYPLIIMGRGARGGEAFGQVALRGKSALQVSRVTGADKADPLNQRSYIGALTWQAQQILNDAWMAVAYVGTEE